MRHPSIVLFASLAAFAALLAPGAAEAKSSKRQTAAVPTIKLVSPMRVRVGRTITIRGKGFSRSRKRNTVLFKSRQGGRSAFAKASRASRTKLVVRIPASAERLLTLSAGKGVATRLTLRVVTSRYGKASKRRHSPVVFSALSTGKTAACGRGDDWDTDLLANDVELKYALDPCKSDTDGDGIGDGWEFWSGKDLNARAVPYPGKRRYANPLDASDAGIDFDGDSLTAGEEHRAWVVTGRSFDPANPNFAAGLQRRHPVQPLEPAVDTDRRPVTDDERDADADGLNNYIEAHGPGQEAWWAATLAEESGRALARHGLLLRGLHAPPLCLAGHDRSGRRRRHRPRRRRRPGQRRLDQRQRDVRCARWSPVRDRATRTRSTPVRPSGRAPARGTSRSSNRGGRPRSAGRAASGRR